MSTTHLYRFAFAPNTQKATTKNRSCPPKAWVRKHARVLLDLSKRYRWHSGHSVKMTNLANKSTWEN